MLSLLNIKETFHSLIDDVKTIHEMSKLRPAIIRINHQTNGREPVNVENLTDNQLKNLSQYNQLDSKVLGAASRVFAAIAAAAAVAAVATLTVIFLPTVTFGLIAGTALSLAVLAAAHDVFKMAKNRDLLQEIEPILPTTVLRTFFKLKDESNLELMLKDNFLPNNLWKAVLPKA